jgi:hypothetical protein
LFIKELDARFSNEKLAPVLALHQIITVSNETLETVKKHYFPNLDVYSDDLDLDRLSHEVSLFARYKSTKPDVKWKNLKTLRKEFVNNNLSILFPQLFLALKIYFAIPVSSAEGERSFSCLRRLKTWLRTTMGEERLSSLALINIESEIAEILDRNELVNKFALERDRMLNFLQKISKT